MNNKKTGAFIRQQRKELFLSQKQLAEKLNVTDKSVSKWETGRGAPDISLLVPLAEVLGVTVTEILKGEKLKEKKLNDASNEIIVKTMKQSKKRIICAAAVMLIIISVLLSLYPAHHFFTSVDANDTRAIEKMANDYFRTDDEDMVIIKSVQKGDYYAFLMQSEKETKLRLFRTDEIFKNRIFVSGGSGGDGVEGDVVHLYCTGENRMNISIFYGYDIKNDKYTYTYKGVKCTNTVENNTVLDMFVEVDDTWTHPLIEYE